MIDITAPDSVLKTHICFLASWSLRRIPSIPRHKISFKPVSPMVDAMRVLVVFWCVVVFDFGFLVLLLSIIHNDHCNARVFFWTPTQLFFCQRNRQSRSIMFIIFKGLDRINFCEGCEFVTYQTSKGVVTKTSLLKDWISSRYYVMRWSARLADNCFSIFSLIFQRRPVDWTNMSIYCFKQTDINVIMLGPIQQRKIANACFFKSSHSIDNEQKVNNHKDKELSSILYRVDDRRLHSSYYSTRRTFLTR